MNFEKELRERISKIRIKDMALVIVTDTSLKEPFLICLKHEDPNIAKRAAWLLTHIHDQNNSYFEKEIPEFIQYIKSSDLNGVLRCVLRCLQDYKIPTKHQGDLISLCFDLLTNNNRPIAVKVFAMTVVYNHCNTYPDLKNELRLVIEDLLRTNSPGIISRGSKILKKIQ